MSWRNSNLTLLFPRATARPHRGTRAPATRAEPSPHRDRVRAPRLARSNHPWPANTCLRGPRARAPDLRGHAVAQVLPDAVSFRVPRCRQFHRYQATKKPGTFSVGRAFALEGDGTRYVSFLWRFARPGSLTPSMPPMHFEDAAKRPTPRVQDSAVAAAGQRAWSRWLCVMIDMQFSSGRAW